MGLKRELSEMRKTMDLPVDAYISTQITIPSEREKKWIEKSIEFIEEETRSKELILSDKANGRFSADFEKKWKINDLSFEIRIKRI